jgi:arginase family enzyme
MDVVETSPQLDPAGITSRMAVRSIVDCLAANALGESHAPGTGTAATENCS